MYETAFHTKDITDKKFLITGGAGFIGSNIVQYLLTHNAAMVRVLDNLATGNQENLKPFLKNKAFEFFEGDIRHADVCKQACEGIDLVTHQAAMGSVPRSIKDPLTTNDVNIGGFINMITAAKDAGVERFVYASSSSVYGDDPNLPKVEGQTGKPLSPYAVSKVTNELYADVFFNIYNLPVIGLRYFNVFGPNQDPSGAYAAVIPLFIDALVNEKPAYIDGDGLQTRDFTYVENAVQANILALTGTNEEAFNKVYNIAVGENFSVIKMYDTLAQIIGSDQKPEHREARVGDIRNSLADISRAENLLGYRPQVRFEDGLQKTVEYFKERFYSTAE